jgi:hypothetical protein
MGEVSQVFNDAPKFIRQLQNSPTTQKSIRAQGRSQTRWLAGRSEGFTKYSARLNIF